MALISCPECNENISDQAKSCPKCGFPIAEKTEKGPPMIPKKGKWKPPVSFWVLFWRAILHPRKTLRLILDNGGKYGTWGMLWIEGIFYVFGTSESHLLSLAKHGLFLNLLVGMPMFVLVGFLMNWLMAYFQYFLGKPLGGTAKPQDLFAVEIWSSPPNLVNRFFTTVSAIPSWMKLAAGEFFLPGDFDPHHPIQYILHGVAYGFFLWSLVVGVIMLAEAQRFKIWKSILLNFAQMALGMGIGALIAGESFREQLIEMFKF